ncbi:response regulator [Mesorhizobium sp. WSM4887]|uniref:response regulator n=1 Tax=Mesorhizobium sp. WSM4887 TaxID=3038543 RepID=UPI002416332E|nr:response regulator [Mesorhizobium sp. WSM4887]MDG4889217.1 response regulator [Mesorhizobium sp. WSM4887]
MALDDRACCPTRTPSANPNESRVGQPVAAALPTRILVVEDDFLISLEMESTLTAAGFEVVVVGSGEEALDSAAADRPDLVVMDIRLSGAMDGIQTALELFRIYGLRSVFATAHSDSDVRARAAPAEPLGWLVKPYTPASLLSAIRSALRSGSSSAG